MLPVSPYTVGLLLGLSALSGFTMLRWMHRRSVLLRLRTVLGEEPDADALSGPARTLHWLGSKIPGASDQSLQTALLKAGYFHPSALHVFVALRLICTGAVFFVVWLHGPGTPATALMLAFFLAFFCSRLFANLLKLQAKGRERALRRELPPFVDVLLMVLNSGVSIDQSLRYVTGTLERTAPLTCVVLKRYVADIDSGVPYEAAFERMGQRLGIDEGFDLANLIKQSLLQGGEIMASLESFGAEMMDKRVAAAREQIGRKSVLLTLVMLAFFMPVLLITLGGPAVSHITRTLATVTHNLHAKGGR